MKLVVLRIGRGKTPWADDACAEYSKRARRQLPIEEVLIPPVKGPTAQARAEEGDNVLSWLKEGDLLVAMDERGKQPSSERFARWIDDAAKTGCKRLVFAIGGPYGHGSVVREQAWRVLALSSMVLNHEVARVVLHEQIYRATDILWGGSYHH